MSGVLRSFQEGKISWGSKRWHQKNKFIPEALFKFHAVIFSVNSFLFQVQPWSYFKTET